MKNIFSRKTNRFVLNLLNGLGFIACLSVSSCGIKEKNPKGMETDNELGGVEDKLKEANGDFFNNLNPDYKEKIVQWFEINSHQTNFTLSEDILKQILGNDYEVNSFEQRLGGDISNPNGEESKKKEEKKEKESGISMTEKREFRMKKEDLEKRKKKLEEVREYFKKKIENLEKEKEDFDEVKKYFEGIIKDLEEEKKELVIEIEKRD